jgi:hypothetical protein
LPIKPQVPLPTTNQKAAVKKIFGAPLEKYVISAMDKSYYPKLTYLIHPKPNPRGKLWKRK